MYFFNHNLFLIYTLVFILKLFFTLIYYFLNLLNYKNNEIKLFKRTLNPFIKNK